MRPTLEEQIKISKMTEEECIKTLCPDTFNFWLHQHCRLMWRLFYWNWFNVLTGEDGVWRFAKHGFKEWG